MENLPVIYNGFTKNITMESESVAVVIIIQYCSAPIVCDTTGIDNVDEAIAEKVRDITFGCNYSYKLVKKVGNVYFYK